MSDKNQKTIVLGITGSIAAYRMCDLILELKEKNVRVIPVLTKDAEQFVTPLTVQSLAAEAVERDFFGLEGHTKPVHTELAKKANLIVVSPASADAIAKIRAGIADNLLLCTVLAAHSPILVVPAMNDRMYANPATQENLQVLKKRGIHVLEPIEGKLVCSDVAMGHINSNHAILDKILSLL